MNEDKRTKILKRIEYLLTVVDHGNRLKNDPINGRFWEGKMSAIDGVDGEIRFLKNLLEEGDES